MKSVETNNSVVMGDSTSSGFYSDAGSSSGFSARPRPGPVSQADTKRGELDMVLQTKLHNLNTKIRLSCGGPTSDDLQAIERERDDLIDLLKRHTQATSTLLTQIEELGGPWTQEWPDLDSTFL